LEQTYFALAGEAHLTWQAEPGHRRHNGSTSPFRWAGVSRSALCLLLQLTAGASQPIHQPRAPCRRYSPCVLRGNVTALFRNGLDAASLYFSDALRLVPPRSCSQGSALSAGWLCARGGRWRVSDDECQRRSTSDAHADNRGVGDLSAEALWHRLGLGWEI
jgi:hypothetical protein